MDKQRTEDGLRRWRWGDFRRRADYAPQKVARHRERGWEYIPIHPFGDEPENLARLGILPADCRSADAWWGIDGDATLLETHVISFNSRWPAGLYAKPTSHPQGWVYLVAVFAAPFVTKTALEAAMSAFADAGFPRDPRFKLCDGDPWHTVAPAIE